MSECFENIQFTRKFLVKEEDRLVRLHLCIVRISYLWILYGFTFITKDFDKTYNVGASIFSP